MCAAKDLASRADISKEAFATALISQLAEGMLEKKPILVWRLDDAPIDETMIEDGFGGDETAYRQWRANKTGTEFVVMVPDDYASNDCDVDYDLGLNVPQGTGMFHFGEKLTSDCEAFSHIDYGQNESGLWTTYNVFIIPSLTKRNPRW